jgi:hypothetical protein
VLPLETDSFEALAVATTALPPQSPAFVDNGGVLEHSSEDPLAKELCCLIASLEAVSPEYCKDIACVLAGKASEDIIKKVEKSLKNVSIWGK